MPHINLGAHPIFQSDADMPSSDSIRHEPASNERNAVSQIIMPSASHHSPVRGLYFQLSDEPAGPRGSQSLHREASGAPHGVRGRRAGMTISQRVSG